ncbi:hypothetical protein KBZ21_01655 [Streptomyces sp. A73]|nr:hypothetical protein [Streptomyces sp. A73]
MRRFEKSTRAEQAGMRLDGEEIRAPSHWRVPFGRHPLLIWLLVTAVFLAAAVLSLATGIEARDPAAADGELAKRSPVTCGSVLRPARWGEDKWDESALAWRTRVCDTARISRLGWTGIFVIGGLAVLVTGAGVCARRLPGTAADTRAR